MEHQISPKLVSLDNIVKSGCFNIENIVSIIETAFLDYKNGHIDLPDKISQIFNQDTQDRINCMTATLYKEKVCGVKWVSVFPENPTKRNLQNVSGTIILSSLENGFPLAIMDGTLVTAIRTACVGAVAAKYLARKNSTVFSCIGAGEQAKMHFIAMKSLFPNLKVCCVASRRHDSVNKFIDDLKDKYDDVEFVSYGSDYDAVVKNADIIVTAVSCQRPLLRANNIKKGAFYCHVGGWEDEYEVPLMADKIVCDSWEAVKHRTQTISRLYQAGRILDTDIYADIADIIDGTFTSRERDDEFIYFNSVGLAFLDIAIANDFYKKSLDAKNYKEWSIQEKTIFELLK